MPKKASSFKKHVQGKKFKKALKIFLKGKKKDCEKFFRKLRYNAKKIKEVDGKKRQLYCMKYVKSGVQFGEMADEVGKIRKLFLEKV
jgi:ribosomal protein L22